MKYLILFPVFLFNLCAFSQTKFEIKNYPLKNEYKTISRDSADLLFKKIKESTVFEFNYTRGGCDYRAHAVYLLLKKQGISTFKIWNFASSKVWNYSKEFIIPDINFNQHNLLLTANDRINLSTESSYYSECGNNSIKNTIHWGYHVAPVLLIKNEEKIDTLVVDPAMFDNLVKPKTWLEAQLQEKSNSYYTFLDGALISFQTSSVNTLTGLFYDDTYSIEQKWIEQSLSKGKVFVEYYENEIKPLEIKLNNHPKDTEDPEAKSLACKIADRKNIISNEFDSSGNSMVNKLPIEYQNKFNKYVKEATKYLFEN
jgi:hypothetical protein